MKKIINSEIFKACVANTIMLASVLSLESHPVFGSCVLLAGLILIYRGYFGSNM